jgi:hypothetical protein
MPTDALILDYAPPAPGRHVVAMARVWRACVSVSRWCLDNRHHFAGIFACAIAAWSISLAWGARVVLAMPSFGGCGAPRVAARGELSIAGLGLLPLPLMWLAARRSRWSACLARVSFAVAVVWWVYNRHAVYGMKPVWYW